MQDYIQISMTSKKTFPWFSHSKWSIILYLVLHVQLLYGTWLHVHCICVHCVSVLYCTVLYMPHQLIELHVHCICVHCVYLYLYCTVHTVHATPIDWTTCTLYLCTLCVHVSVLYCTCCTCHTNWLNYMYMYIEHFPGFPTLNGV